MTPSNVQTIFISFIENLSQIVQGGLPSVVTIAAALIGLGILVRYVVRWIGGTGLTYEMEADHDMRNRVWRGGGPEF